MGKENKCGDAEMEIRISIILDMLLSGLRRREILQNIATNEALKWDVSDRQIDEYIRLANEEISKIAEKDKDKTYRKVKSRLEFLYRKSIEVRDYKTALVVNEKEAELDGLKITKQENRQIDGEGKDVTLGYDLSKLSAETLKDLMNASSPTPKV